jgi:hypothetical protein
VSELIIPPIEGDGDWPSLGGQVADWQEANLAFGPGDLLGRPYVLDDEDRALAERSYQVFPPDHKGRCAFEPEGGSWRCTRGSGLCGRRRFDTVVVMTRKGTKKSERGGALAAVEMAIDGPVRCDGFRRESGMWIPIGRPVVSPFVFVFAFAKEQAEDTAWDSMSQMIEQGPGAHKFQIWESRILRSDGTGEAKPLASAPDSRDGGRTTFQLKEESHRYTTPRHREAHITTAGNLSKRPIAEPWEAHLTTMYAPGEGSVAEDLHDAARKMTPAERKRSRMFFFYRWADEKIKIRDEDGNYIPESLHRAIVNASGPVISRWSDPDDIARRQFLAPGADGVYAERVWLGRGRRRLELAFDAESWKRNTRKGMKLLNEPVVLSFDGSRGSPVPTYIPDHSGLVATGIKTGLQVVLGDWDPADYPGRMIPRDEVEVCVDEAFRTLDVWRLYGDPPEWGPEMATWAAKYGETRVLLWWTRRDLQMGLACANYAKAIEAGLVLNDGDPALAAHVGHCHRRLVNARDDRGERLWTVQKERPGSPLKIDLAVCGIIGWEGRNDAIAAGALHTPNLEPLVEWADA